jgi:hypothetical protein
MIWLLYTIDYFELDGLKYLGENENLLFNEGITNSEFIDSTELSLGSRSKGVKSRCSLAILMDLIKIGGFLDLFF